MSSPQNENLSDAEKAQKIQSLREMIGNAEKTIQSAKAMLLQFEGKKKAGRKRKIDEDEEGSIVQGTFDGQIMMGSDGKQYPVPANYASKSKLVEGDLLKLTITPDGSFIYKQIGPVERKHALGIVAQDEAGNYYIVADGKPFKILLASITYFRAEPGDEVAIVVPRDLESHWASIENVVQKAKHSADSPMTKVEGLPTAPEKKPEEPKSHEDIMSELRGERSEEVKSDKNESKEDEPKEESEEDENTNEQEQDDDASTLSLLEEWQSDIEEIEKEIEAASQKEKETSEEEHKVKS